MASALGTAMASATLFTASTALHTGSWPAVADPSTTYNFLGLADWGSDDEGQYAAAKGLGAVAEEINATQVFVLGDNFYHSGIHVPEDGYSGEKRFEKTFENVYTAPSLKNIPFWAIAGNHDHYGNVTAQIEYSHHPQNVGRRWKFPHYWYNVTNKIEVGGKQVELEMLLFDSVIMVGNSGYLDENGKEVVRPLNEMRPDNESLAQEQLDWLTQRMEASTADYLWVGGHFPVWAIGNDPPTGVRQILRDLLNKWEAQYFNGHEHDFEHIIEKGTKVNYISTGAGMYCCYDDTHLNTVPQGSIKFASSGKNGAEWWGGVPIPNFDILSGFTSYRVGPESMQVVYHAHNGTVLYATDPILPRTKTPQPPPPPIAPFCSDATCPHANRPGL